MMLQASPARAAAAAAAAGGRRHSRQTAAAAAAAAPAAAAGARSRSVLVRAQKEKVNKRGKVASRPGTQPSPKEQAKLLREQRQANRLADASAPPPPSSASAADAAPVDAALDPARTPARAPAAPAPARASPMASSTPQVVVDRMFRRMVVSAGTPVLLGVLLLPAFWYARVVAKIEYPPWLVYLTQGLFFGGGLLGITYGILSTSWEPRREGSALGFEEFKTNLAVMMNRGGQERR